MEWRVRIVETQSAISGHSSFVSHRRSSKSPSSETAPNRASEMACTSAKQKKHPRSGFDYPQVPGIISEQRFLASLVRIRRVFERPEADLLFIATAGFGPGIGCSHLTSSISLRRLFSRRMASFLFVELEDSKRSRSWPDTEYRIHQILPRRYGLAVPGSPLAMPHLPKRQQRIAEFVPAFCLA
jgi:hypothetical protein